MFTATIADGTICPYGFFRRLNWRLVEYPVYICLSLAAESCLLFPLNMAERLPEGWVRTTLGQVNTPSRVRALPTEFADSRYVGLEHVEANTMRLLGFGVADNVRSSSLRFKKGDVLYGKMRPYLNKVWLAEFDGLCSPEFLVFPKNPWLNNKYFAYRLNSQDFVEFANRQISGERPRVDFEKLSDFPYLLAPTREQSRIVEKLDALLAQLAVGETAARRAQGRILRYRAVVVNAAVKGELTREWRRQNKPQETGIQLLESQLSHRQIYWEKSQLKKFSAAGGLPKDDKWKRRYRTPFVPEVGALGELPNGWALASWDQVSDWVTYGFTRPMPHVKKGIPIVTAKNIRDRRVDFDNTNFTVRSAFKELSAKDIPQKGDILITKDGTIGRAAVVENDQQFCINQSVAVVWLRSTKIVRAYLLNVIESQNTQDRIWEKARGVAIKHLSITDFSQMVLPLPSIEEQKQIVGEIDRRFNSADRLAQTLDEQIVRARVTRESLLKQAFDGRLVPQAGDDESASITLRRICDARESENKKPKPKRMPKRKPQPVESLEQLEVLVKDLGRSATPERTLLAAGLGEDVERFFELLRAGRDCGSLLVPIGKGTAIRRNRNAN